MRPVRDVGHGRLSGFFRAAVRVATVVSLCSGKSGRGDGRSEGRMKEREKGEEKLKGRLREEKRSRETEEVNETDRRKIGE